MLSSPTTSFPGVFGSWHVLATYPFLLPCAVASVCNVVGLLIGYFFLSETLEDPVSVGSFLAGTDGWLVGW